MPSQARLRRKLGEQLLERPAGGLGHVQHGEGVEIAGPVVLRQARLRAHAHRRAHALAVAEPADAARSAQVAGDRPQRPARPGRHEAVEPLGDEPVARPVKAPPPHEMLLGPLRRHGVEAVAIGDRGVEAGLEGRHQGHARQLLGHQPHRPHVGRVVGRGHLRHLLHRREHLGRDPRHAPCPAAVHRLEADRRHVGDARQRPAGAGQLLEAPPARATAWSGTGIVRLEQLASPADA